MAKGWKCPHCSTENPETTLTCTGCRRIQGSVVVPGSQSVMPMPPAPSVPAASPADSAAAAPTHAPPTSPWAVNLDAVPPASTPLWRKIPDLKEPDAEEIFDVTAHPCTEAHEYEVFYVGSLAGGEYPTDDVTTTFVVDNCGPAFDAYIGKAYVDSQLDFSYLSPSVESWRDGDRSVQCAAFDPRNARLTISIKGIAE
jgi:hypothetical protein